MAFFARLIRYIFWILVVSWSYWLLRRLVNQMVRTGPTSRPDIDVPPGTVSRKLVRDPVCGMHLAEHLAIPLRQGSDFVHFCSVECRDRYVSETRKFVANS